MVDVRPNVDGGLWSGCRAAQGFLEATGRVHTTFGHVHSVLPKIVVFTFLGRGCSCLSSLLPLYSATDLMGSWKLVE